METTSKIKKSSFYDFFLFFLLFQFHIVQHHLFMVGSRMMSWNSGWLWVVNFAQLVFQLCEFLHFFRLEKSNVFVHFLDFVLERFSSVTQVFFCKFFNFFLCINQGLIFSVELPETSLFFKHGMGAHFFIDWRVSLLFGWEFLNELVLVEHVILFGLWEFLFDLFHLTIDSIFRAFHLLGCLWT